MKKIKILTLLFILSLIVYAWSINRDNQTIDNLEIKKAVSYVDSIEENTLYRLKGEWEFYPSHFLMNHENNITKEYREIEHNWSNDASFSRGFGYASYRLVLKGLDPTLKYGLLLEEAGSSYELYINNELALSNGRISTKATESYGKSTTDRALFKSDENGNAEIVIEISNYVKSNSGFTFAPLLGPYDTIEKFYETSVLIELFVFASMFTLSVLFGLIALIIKDKRSFYTSILTLIISIRIISIGNHLIYTLNPFFELSLIWILRLEYLSIFLMLPIVNLLVSTFTQFNRDDKLSKISMILIVVFSVFTLLAQHSDLEMMYIIFQVLVGLFGVYYLYVCYLAIKWKQTERSNIFIILIAIGSALISIFFLTEIRYSLYFMMFTFTLYIATTVIYRFSIINERTLHLENIVKIDPLTKLWNRSYLNDLKFDTSKFEMNDVYYVLFIDFNGFKQINDEYGHKVGDEVLRMAARRLRNSCHESDIIIRMGGDEFIILAHMKNRDFIEKVIMRIRDNFKDPFTIGDIQVNLSFAIGYHQFIPNSDDLDTIIAISDKKMYKDKRNSTNR